MIPKCIAVLAVIAQINASGCGLSPLLFQNGGSRIVMVSPGNSEYSSGVTTRNFVAKNKYPVALDSCGPFPDSRVPISTSHVQAPLQEKPTIRLPARIPAPRTVAHTCTCYKTIMRPRVHDQYITVPSVQQYVETSHKPVVENIQYEALPFGCGSVSGSGSLSGDLVSGSGPQIEIPRLQVMEAPRVQFQQPISFGSCQC